MMMTTISLESPSRQGARTGTLDPRSRVSGGGGAVYHFLENPSGLLRFGDDVKYVPKESPGVAPHHQVTPRRGWGQAAPGGLVAPSKCPSGSVGLPVKNNFGEILGIF